MSQELDTLAIAHTHNHSPKIYLDKSLISKLAENIFKIIKIHYGRNRIELHHCGDRRNGGHG